MRLLFIFLLLTNISYSQWYLNNSKKDIYFENKNLVYRNGLLEYNILNHIPDNNKFYIKTFIGSSKSLYPIEAIILKNKVILSYNIFNDEWLMSLKNADKFEIIFKENNKNITILYNNENLNSAISWNVWIRIILKK